VVVEALRPQYPSLARAWVEQLSRDLLATVDGPFLALRNGEVLPWEQVHQGMTDLLSKVTVPTLVLVGDPMVGGMMGAEQRELLRTVLPSAHLIDFPGCGHHLEAASPEVFIAHVEAFLAGS
jgi:pimeloyl-ACP methyl ester carboxylesterase